MRSLTANTLKAEILLGIRSTWPYLLSHHEPKEYYRCYKLGKVRICARCVGIYAGLATGFLLHTHFVNAWLLPAVLPAFSITDWVLTRLTGCRGMNLVRSATGFLLGFAFIIGIFMLSRYPALLLAAAGYGLIALFVIRKAGLAL